MGLGEHVHGQEVTDTRTGFLVVLRFRVCAAGPGTAEWL